MGADREGVLNAVHRGGLALKHAHAALRGDRAVVLCAVKNNGMALRHASPALQADWEIVKEAVRSAGQALQYASPAYQHDRDIVRDAVFQDPSALQWASPSLQADEEIITATQRTSNYPNGDSGFGFQVPRFLNPIARLAQLCWTWLSTGDCSKRRKRRSGSHMQLQQTCGFQRVELPYDLV